MTPSDDRRPPRRLRARRLPRHPRVGRGAAMTARGSAVFLPTPRSEGPPGIDWTPPVPDCPACWREWLAGEVPSGPLISRRTQATLAAATLALSSTAPAAVTAAQPPHNHGHAGLHDSNPGDTGVDPPGDDSPGGSGEPEPEPPDTDPDGPDPETTPAPEPSPSPPPQDQTPDDDSGPVPPA